MNRCEQIWYVVKDSINSIPTDEWPEDINELMDEERCENEATQTLLQTGSPYPDLNGPINVCDNHARHVELMNELNRLMGGEDV